MTSRPLPVLAGVYYSIITGQADGKPSNNIFSFQVTPAPVSGTPDVAAATAVANAIHTRWPTFVSAVMPQQYTASQVKTYPLNTPTAPAVVVPMTATGGFIGNTAPVMVGALFKHTVVRRGKGSQSRTTISPITETNIDTPPLTVTSSFQISSTAAFIAFINGVEADVAAALSGTSCAYVQLSKGTAHAAPAAYVISASAMELKLTTQRRRAQR